MAYVTDLEGSRLRFERFMSRSEAFELGGDGRYHLKPGAHFVFGGDAPDRFLGSRWVVSELVRLKEEAPDRVALILGNRDINKMRLTSELSPGGLETPPIKFFFTQEEAWKAHQGPEPRAERLKYILASTMGAPVAFDLRRQELAGELGVDPARVSDDVVAESFLRELGPGGAFRRFLQLGQLAHRIGNTLFVHGGVTSKNLGVIPGRHGKRLPVDRWISGLNRWLRRGVHLWSERPAGLPASGPRPEQPWLDYAMTDPGSSSRPTSVMNARNADPLNNPFLPPRRVIRDLLAQGIERVVIGHTPTGDFPAILRTMDERFEVVCADNSRARDEGLAALVHFKGSDLEQTVVLGKLTLENGAVEVLSDLTLGQSTPIGKSLDIGLLLGRRVDDPSTLVGFRYGENFRTITSSVPENGIEHEKLLEPGAEACLAMLGPNK